MAAFVRAVLVTALFLCLGLGSREALAQGAPCAPLKAWEEVATKAGERLVGVGMIGKRIPMRVYVGADSRSFTVIMVGPSPELWCGVAAGTDFDFVRPGKSDKESGVIVHLADAEGWGGLTSPPVPPMFGAPDACVPVFIADHVEQECMRSFGAQGSVKIRVPLPRKEVRT